MIAKVALLSAWRDDVSEDENYSSLNQIRRQVREQSGHSTISMRWVTPTKEEPILYVYASGPSGFSDSDFLLFERLVSAYGQSCFLFLDGSSEAYIAEFARYPKCLGKFRKIEADDSAPPNFFHTSGDQYAIFEDR